LRFIALVDDWRKMLVRVEVVVGARLKPQFDDARPLIRLRVINRTTAPDTGSCVLLEADKVSVIAVNT
jgi:hypothetical protein